MKPRLLDLFAGAGGAGMDYHLAGFDVVGVDIEPQPNYPFEHWQLDALDVLDWLLTGRWQCYSLGDFDAIHASPPCQHYVQWNNLNRARNGSVPEHVDLIPPTREKLEASGLPWVMENVVGSTLRNSVLLCGSMFGLGVRRHRLFESNVLLMRSSCSHTRREIAVYGKLDGRRVWTRTDGTEVRVASTLEQAQRAMGIDWMGWSELTEAIPPAYTRHIGGQLLSTLGVAA